MKSISINNIENQIDNSMYISWVKQNYVVLFVCAVIAVILCALSYPGVLYSDSYARISFAGILEDSMNAFFSGDAGLNRPKMWLTIAPSFFILLSQKISGGIFLNTYLQCFSCLFIIYSFVGKLSKSKKYALLTYLLIVAMPIVWGYSVYYEPSVGCVIALLALLCLEWKYDGFTIRIDQIISVLLIVVFAFIAFGFRANAFTVLPIFIFLTFKKYHMGKEFIVLSAAVLVGFFITIIGPRMLNVDAMSSYVASFFWESVSTIQSIDDETKDDYLKYYDDLFGEGFTQAAVERNTYKEDGASINPLLGDDLSQICVIIDDNATSIMSRYCKLIINEPKSFLTVKIDMMLHSLGLNKPLVFTEYDYNRWGQMTVFGFNDSKPRERFVGTVLSYMGFMGIFLRPWVLYLTAFVLIIVYRLKMPEKTFKMTMHEDLYIMSVFYYGAFLINTQSFEFRYFFPAWLMLIIIIVSLAVRLISEVGLKNKTIIAISVFCVLFIQVTGTYEAYMRKGRMLLESIESNAELVYNDNTYKVYRFENNLAYVTAWNANTDFTFFLRCYMTDGNSVNGDFSFGDMQIDTSLFSKKIALVELPGEAIDYLETGQMYGNTLFWGDRIEFDR